MTNQLAEQASPQNSVSASQGRHVRRLRTLVIVGMSAIVLSLLMMLNQLEWARVFPEGWTVDAGGYVTRFLGVVTGLSIGPWSIVEISRAIASVLSFPEQILSGLLAEGFRFSAFGSDPVRIPAIPWFSVTLVFLIASLRFGGPRLALLVGVCLVYFLFTGLWESALRTLVTVMVAIPIGCGVGLLLGILAYRHPTAEAILEPIYDTMQTLPIFSYLVLIVVFFGFGPVAGLVALVVYAMPPMARVTTFALRRTPRSIIELAEITGCTPRQRCWNVQVPAARATLLTGLNQVIMLTFSTVIICAIIGGEGLGAEVLKGLKSMRLGGALVAGVAITLMAIAIDRACRVWVMRRPEQIHGRGGMPTLALCLGILLLGVAVAWLFPQAAQFPSALEFQPGKFLNQQLRIFNLAYQSELSTFRDGMISWLLRPARELFASFGWLASILGMAGIALAVGGRKLAVMVVILLGVVALFGLWPKAMLSLYLVMVSTLTAIVLGIPLGIVAGRNRKAHAVLEVFADTLQTLPAFVYLIPVVVLFEVGDFAAFVAIVLFGLAPVSRYIAASLQQVGGEYKEVARMNGCTPLQEFFHVQLPLAFPQMLLGINQTIMLSFGMLIVVALVGAQGLEAETLSAIGRVQPGQGLIAGLGIAALAISVDRTVRAAVNKLTPGEKRVSGKKA
ncbi:ABC transporter permease subunit [Pseudomonas sp. BN414]|uniref:ABC transporter permease n=1 Tax=Pseudomonas sp. BN414 TaxID=2567888 RepID=UPI00245802E0|nr:ABC transporter permease subunit [Pseudomonas sp. BN414]